MKKILRLNNSEKKDDQFKDIWKLHTDVQEQMVKLRCAPISIISDSIKIIDEKLFLSVDENEKSDKIIDEITSLFNIDSESGYKLNGYFLCDKLIAQNIANDKKVYLSEKASMSFINFHPQPIIDGFVNERVAPVENLKKILDISNYDYRFDEKGRLQITIDDLLKFNDSLSIENKNILIPEIASIILPISANLKHYIVKDYPFISDNLSFITINNTITTKNRYFSDSIYERLSEEINLKLNWYKYIFKVDSSVIRRYNSKNNPYELPQLNEDDNSFTFYINADKNYSDLSLACEEEKLDFDFKYTRLRKFFDSLFGEENVMFESIFNYSYNTDVYNKIFLSDLENTVFSNLSFSEENMYIGVDFNWQNTSIEQLITELSSEYPYVYFNLFKNHRCNIDFQIQNITLDAVENQLREKFPSITTKRNDKKGEFYFFQDYQNEEQGVKLRQIIENEIRALNTSTFEVGLYPIPENREKYILEIDIDAKKEMLTSRVKELRGCDFSVGEHEFGKLFRVNYPQLIFDISGDNFEQTKQLFESHSVASILPNLIGELEKINRLKSSLNNILSGNNLQNPNLKDFIFDAQKAKKIDDVDSHIDPRSDDFNELDAHLLNDKVNLPQKQAIIKTMLAEDLALIQGPPGTGKSTAIAEIIWQHIRKDPKERIMLTSETNLAVDNAIDRVVNNNHNLVKPIRIGDDAKLESEGRQFSLSVMKRWVETGSIGRIEGINDTDEDVSEKLILINWIDNIKNRAISTTVDDLAVEEWKRLLSNPPKEIREVFYDNYIKNCNLIGATCSSIGKLNTKGRSTGFYRTYCEIFGDKSKRYDSPELIFTTIIQDESSKATPAELSLPLVYGKKNIVIGDHRQLPPMLDKEEFKLSLDFLLDKTEKEEEKKQIRKLKTFVMRHFNEMEVSHFERLFEQIDDSLKGLFNLQYRMHPDINDVIKQFYIQDGGLECGLIAPIDLGVNNPDMSKSASRYHGIEIEGLLTKDTHTIWIDTNSPELLDGTSRINYGEVEAIREVLTQFRHSDSFRRYQSFWDKLEDQQIGLISFYGKQIKLLQNLRNEFKDIPIRVSTVDRFQGMERNIIIVSMVRSNRIASDKKQKADINLYGEFGYPEQKDLGFAQSPNRLNVALSRAKRLLIIVGNSELFSQKEIYKNVYESIANNPNSRIIKYDAQ